MVEERTLTTAVASAVLQWQRQAPQWSRLHWSPHADRVPPLPPPADFEWQLLQALTRAESNCRKQGEAAAARLEMGRHGDHIQVTLSCLNECWNWAFACRPELGGQPRTRVKRQVVLPATAPPIPRPWDETELYDPVCVLSCNPSTIEMIRSLLCRLPCRRLWHTTSGRLAQAWLAAHPRCPLWLNDRPDGLAIADPAALPGTPSVSVAPPLTTTPIWLAARKIYPWPPGTNY